MHRIETMLAGIFRHGFSRVRSRTHWTVVNCVHIYASATPNPQAYKFQSIEDSDALEHYLNFGIDQYSPRQFSSAENAERHSKLASEVLHSNPDVESIFLGDNFLTVQKSNSSDWEDIIDDLEKTIQDFFTGYDVNGVENTKDNENVSKEETFENRANLPSRHPDRKLAQEIENTINELARPHVQSDGGDVKFVMIDGGGVVHLQMLGACVSCPSSTVTVRFMIKNMLQHYFEEVTDCVHVDWEE